MQLYINLKLIAAGNIPWIRYALNYVRIEKVYVVYQVIEILALTQMTDHLMFIKVTVYKGLIMVYIQLI